MKPPPYAPPKRDFIGKAAPPGYVAGVGRGATGFTTRSDFGQTREPGPSSSTSTDFQKKSSAVRKLNADEDDEEAYLNESNYDEFAGYKGSICNKDPYDEDDEEADKIYQEIDKHLEERGKALREASKRQELERYRQERPKIQQQFTDLKACLKQVSEEEWKSIPDVGDARNRKQRVARQEKFTPVPDSLLAHQAKLASGGENLVYIEPKDQPESDAMVMSDSEGASSDGQEDDKNPAVKGESSTVANSGGTMSNLNISEMSEFRSSYMSMKLSHISSTVDQASTNPQDYLTNLQSMIPSQITDAATLKEYRKQFKALRKSNPTFQNAWIASVRLEEAAGKLSTARSLILEACQECPKSADLWCEAARLHPRDMAKVLMVRALREDPRSVKLWIHSADLETSDEAKRRIYEKAREMIPKSVLLWKKSVELEGPEEARRILREAVECCPEAVELWLALARLESNDEARKILAEASNKNPTDRSIWIMAAKLEEVAGNKSLVVTIVNHSISELSRLGVKIERADWFQEAIDADKAGFNVTSEEIIKRMINWGLGDNLSLDERLKLLHNDVEHFIKFKSINCARTIHECIVGAKDFCNLEKVWCAYIEFEKRQGDQEKLKKVLKRSVSKENCINSESLWLLLAAECKKDQPLDEIRQILSDALDANPDSEKIIISAVELECDNSNFKEARRILADACMSAKTPELIKRSAKLEWNLNNLDEAVRMLKAGVEEYKNFPDFYLMLGQIEEERGQNDKAKAYYSNGLKFNPTCVDLWICMANIEEKTGFLAKARSKLEMARLRNPKVPKLWLEAARLEMRAYMAKKGNNNSIQGSATMVRPDIVITLLAKGLKECKDHPDVGMLYSEQSLISKRKFV